ncbi:hypothetical protein ACLOJK_021386 [Asimina triloba]
MRLRDLTSKTSSSFLWRRCLSSSSASAAAAASALDIFFFLNLQIELQNQRRGFRRGREEREDETGPDVLRASVSVTGSNRVRRLGRAIRPATICKLQWLSQVVRLGHGSV